MTPTLTLEANVRIDGCPWRLVRYFQTVFSVSNPKYVQAVEYGRHTDEDPELYFWEQDGADSIILPRGASRFVWDKLKEHCRPRFVDRRLKFQDVPFTFQGQLRPYQERALRELHKAPFGTLMMSTGGGKTILALASIAERKQPAIVICHTKELLYQWRDRAMQFLGLKEDEVGLVGDGHYTIRPLTVALVQTARKHLDDLPGTLGM